METDHQYPKHESTAEAHRYLSYFYVGLIGIAAVIFSVGGSSTSFVDVLSVFVALGAFWLLHFQISKGAESRKSWARICSLVIGSILLIGFPIGTAIGWYLISLSSKPWPEPTHLSGSIFDLENGKHAPRDGT